MQYFFRMDVTGNFRLVSFGKEKSNDLPKSQDGALVNKIGYLCGKGRSFFRLFEEERRV